VYMLTKSESGSPRYVGRASKLYERLSAHAQNGHYNFFTFEYIDSPRQCFVRECTLYHRHRKAIDNQNHPTADSGANWRCPVCGF